MVRQIGKGPPTYENPGGNAGIIDIATLKLVWSLNWCVTGAANLDVMSSPLADGGIDMFAAVAVPPEPAPTPTPSPRQVARRSPIAARPPLGFP